MSTTRIFKNVFNKIRSVLDKQNYEEINSKIDSIEETHNNIVKEIQSLKKNLDNVQTFNREINNVSIPREAKKDKPLFILASGPSLKDVNISIFKNCYTMAFNRSYIAFKEWGFEPTYFVGLDHIVNADNKDAFINLIANSHISRFFFSKSLMTSDNFSFGSTSLIEIDDDPENASLNFNKILKVGNSGLFGLQIALGILGFTEVYLLGCDANYTDNVKGVKNMDGKYISNSNEDVNHFRQDYYGKGTTYSKPGALRWHLPAWKNFYYRYLENNISGYKVYNCSPIGKLTFYPYADIRKIQKDIKRYEYK